jgi:hypothetical protein
MERVKNTNESNDYNAPDAIGAFVFISIGPADRFKRLPLYYILFFNIEKHNKADKKCH